MRRLCIDHLSEYRFAAPVTLLPHRMLLRPRENHGLRIVSASLEIEPTASIRWHRDPLDNSVAIVTFAVASDLLRVASSLVVEHFDESPLDFVVENHAVMYPFGYVAALPGVREIREGTHLDRSAFAGGELGGARESPVCMWTL